VRPKPAVILYVEQNRMLLQTVRDVLEFAGWYVRPCSDDGYAVAYVESQEHFDLLLIDHDFRNFSGLALTERARRQPHRQKTPVVLISLEDITDEAKRAGADAFLRKPNNLIELVETISKAARRSRRGCPRSRLKRRRRECGPKAGSAGIPARHERRRREEEEPPTLN
jgi:CheY-like chemotaxis protein